MMTLAQLEERIRVARMIVDDAEADAKALDGKPFTGRAVAEAMGEHLAQTQALARLVVELYEDRADELRALTPAQLEPPADHVERP